MEDEAPGPPKNGFPCETRAIVRAVDRNIVSIEAKGVCGKSIDKITIRIAVCLGVGRSRNGWNEMERGEVIVCCVGLHEW